MACPNCDHTMESVGHGLFWCPRCGTQKDDGGIVWTPKLIERCREFAARVCDGDFIDAASSVLVGAEWMACGIDESINVRANRSGGGMVNRGHHP